MYLAFFRPWLVLGLLAAFPLALAATPPRGSSPPVRVTWVQLGHRAPAGSATARPVTAQPVTAQADKTESPSPSLLGVPENCAYTACPLVVVSHPRGQTPERLYHSTGVKVLTDALLEANYAVLLSNDGGPLTWGSPSAFQQVVGLQRRATKRFLWNQRTYALGLSMGGLMALRSALPGSPYEVSGLALIDAWTNLDAAWHASPQRQAEIKTAYASASAPGSELTQLAHRRDLPMFVVASPDDTVVPWQLNSKQVFRYADRQGSEFVTLSGPHLGGNRFSHSLARQLVDFFQRLELQAKRRAE